MDFLRIYFLLPIINALVIVKIHQNSFYHLHSPCSFIRNISLSNDSSIQSCIRECVSEHDCQTAVYFYDNKNCSMFAEPCTIGNIESSGNIHASVICYRQDNKSIITCPSTLTTIVDVTTSTMENTITTATVFVPFQYIFRSFESNLNELEDSYNNVTTINNTDFISPGYTGYGSALSLDAAQFQCALVSKYINMTYTSFTWEIWAYPLNLVSYDNELISVCEITTTDKCLHILIRNNASYFGFYGDDCPSSTIVSINQWHHFAFVYDYTNSTKYIYLNGDLVCKQNSSGIFQGNLGVITIGALTIPLPYNYWTGYIDQVLYISRAKTADEILIDATLVAYYSFDNGSFIDFGPNKMNGTGVRISSTPGRINEGILFNESEAYFQANGFTLLGASYRSYSVALWIYKWLPAVGNGTIVYLSAKYNTSLQPWCIPIIGLTSSYQIVGQSWNGNLVSIVGPTLSFGVWTHIVTTYSATNGLRLWVNGTLINSSSPFIYDSSGIPNTITLGSFPVGMPSCLAYPIADSQFYGMMDELRIYSRELNASDIQTLSNP